jgi:hypothetical protein
VPENTQYNPNFKSKLEMKSKYSPGELWERYKVTGKSEYSPHIVHDPVVPKVDTIKIKLNSDDIAEITHEISPVLENYLQDILCECTDDISELSKVIVDCLLNDKSLITLLEENITITWNKETSHKKVVKT